MTTQHFPGDPQGFVLLAMPAGVWEDWSAYAVRPLTIMRANPGQPARVTINLWKLGGGIVVPDFMPIRIYDPYMNPGGLYVRYFNGLVINPTATIQNNVIQAYTLECSGWDWLWQNPPARPVTTLTVGAPPVWLQSHTYSAGDTVQPDPTNNHKYTSSGGTSAGSPPTWPTGAGATVTDGSGSTQITWTEAGSAAVSDQDVILQLLDIYYPPVLGVITHTGIQKLITSVPSFTVDASMTMDDCLKKLAAFAPSTGYYATYPAWPGAGQTVAIGHQIEQSPSVHGLIFQCTGNGITGGSVPAFTAVTTIGTSIIDGTVVWQAVFRTGRFEPSTTMVQGQRIEPDLAHLNGIWYQALNDGTTGVSSPASWPTTLGATVSTGGVTLLAAGVTSVAPVWQMWDPSDNFGHTASWTPNAAWFDSNTQTQTVLAKYADAPAVQDTLHIHYASLTISRQSTAYANRWYVTGRNSSEAMVESLPAQTAVQGLIISKYYSDTSDTGPSTPDECAEIGANLLAISIMRETADLKSAKILDPVMIQKLTSGEVVAALLGLDHTYPAISVQVTLGLGAPVWEVQFGAGYITDRQDVYSNIRGGRPFAIDKTPPALASWDNNPSHGNYFLVGNTLDPQSLTAIVVVQWGETSADTNIFQGFYLLAGNQTAHWLPTISYPVQSATIRGLPRNTAMTIYLTAIDRAGNQLRDGNGNVIWSTSPTFTTAAFPSAPHVPKVTSVSQRHDLDGYRLVATVDKNSPGDDASGGGQIRVIDVLSGTPHYYNLPGTEVYPVSAALGQLVTMGYQYKVAFQIFDQYQQPSGFTADTLYTVVSDRPPAPHVTTAVDFPEGAGGAAPYFAFYYADVTVDKASPGDDGSGTGGYVKTKRSGYPNIITPIPPNSTFPVTVRVDNLIEAETVNFEPFIANHWGEVSPAGVDYLFSVLPTRPPAPSITNPIPYVRVAKGYIARVIVNSGGGDVSGGGWVFWTATTDAPAIPIPHMSPIPANSTFPFVASCEIDVNVTESFTAIVIDSFGQWSTASAAVTVRASNGVPAKVASPVGWRGGGVDQVLAGWLPVSPAVNGDFTIAADGTGAYDSASLQATIPAAGSKKIQSPPFACTPGETRPIQWSSKVDVAGLVSGKAFIQPQSWDGVEGHSPVSVGGLLQIGATQTLGATYPTVPYISKVTIPAGATQFVIILEGDNASGGTRVVSFSHPNPNVVGPAQQYNQATSTDPIADRDENGDIVIQNYWSPGAHKQVHKAVTTNTTYPSIGHEFDDSTGLGFDVVDGVIAFGAPVAYRFLNKSGGSVDAGDIVVLDTTTNASFTTTTTANLATKWVGVAQETIASNDTGRVALYGYVPKVNLRTSATRGDFIFTSSSVKQAERTGSFTTGVFGQTLGTGTTPAAILFGGLPQHDFLTFELDLLFDSGDSGTSLTPYSIPAYKIPTGCTVTGAHLYAKHGSSIGSAIVDIWVNASQWPTSADSICGTSKPTITSGDHVDDTVLSGWTPAIAAGSWLIAELHTFTALSVVSQLTLALDLVRS